MAPGNAYRLTNAVKHVMRVGIYPRPAAKARNGGLMLGVPPANSLIQAHPVLVQPVDCRPVLDEQLQTAFFNFLLHVIPVEHSQTKPIIEPALELNRSKIGRM